MADGGKKRQGSAGEPASSDNSLINKVEELVQAAREGFRDMRDEVSEIDQRYRAQEKNLRDIEMNQVLQEKDLRRLLSIIDGNGEKPLTVRLTRLDSDIESLSQGLNRIGDQLTEISADIKDQKKVWSQRAWEILKPLIAAALGAAAVASGTGTIPW